MFGFKKALIWLAILIPPVAFYWILFTSLKGLPVSDDYGAVLEFLLRWKKETGLQHIVQIVMSQNNDYRLMLENGVYGLQYLLLGHTNLKALAVLGDLFVIPLFFILYLIWLQCGRPRDYTFLAFVPVSWILFQLQYASALDNASAPLQIIPVVVFALLACFLILRPGVPSFIACLLSLLLCIASSGNGLFMIPIGVLVYVQHKKFKRLAVWCVVGALAAMIYFYRYDFSVEMSHTHAQNNVVSLFEHLSPSFYATFLGAISAAANPLPAIVFGTVLTGVFLIATFDRLYARHPELYYSALFFVVTAVAFLGTDRLMGL